jgi:3-oxoacyl-[acyl-carrier-protein] synthase-1
MTEVFIVSDNIYAPLGVTSGENFLRLTEGEIGVKEHRIGVMSEQPFYAALFGEGEVKEESGYTRFEQVLIGSIQDALSRSGIQNGSGTKEGNGIEAGDKKTVLILSTTKGNISLLETEAGKPGLAEQVALHGSAGRIARHFGFVHPPIVVSHACVSGIMAMLTGMRLIQSGQYEHAVIAGADLISKFILSGFQAFQAVSPGYCKPFDRRRDGINLGEGAATVVLSSNRKYDQGMRMLGGAISNDANHLSAPSRTGEELAYAIGKSLSVAGLSPGDIDMVSAHGTATVYNDEMEAKALHLAGLGAVPVNSLKGYYGHTLGAAGLIESIVSLHSLRENIVLPTAGFEEMGVSQPLNVSNDLLRMPLKTCLKTASGFGGCNAAILLGKS